MKYLLILYIISISGSSSMTRAGLFAEHAACKSAATEWYTAYREENGTSARGVCLAVPK